MKKFVLLALLFASYLVPVVTSAQEVTYVEDPSQGYLFNRMKDNWFITGDGGVTTSTRSLVTVSVPRLTCLLVSGSLHFLVCAVVSTTSRLRVQPGLVTTQPSVIAHGPASSMVASMFPSTSTTSVWLETCSSMFLIG